MDGGASWISYSDMMAAMLLVFVLILCYSLYQYYKMLDEKEAALAHQQSMLTSQEALLTAQQATLADRENELRAAQIILTENELLLLDNQAKLEEQETALSLSQALLSAQQTRLDEASLLLSSQQQLLDDQQEKIDTLLGVRTRIIQDLSQSLSQENLRAAVDPKTGNIVVESTVFFDTGKSDIKESGKQLLNRFIPVYLNVLLRPEYSDYLGSIIVEGHTDTQGGYLMNLGLSQERALAVVTYCLTDMPGLNADQRAALERTVTPTGRSYSSPVYHPDGTVNMEQSRRVEFKFSLKDAEMIDEMNRILSR
jgi:chemotaxis protein MotB